MRLLCVVPGNSGFCAIRQLLQRSLLGLSQASQASPTQSRPSQRRSARRPVVEKEVNWTPAMVDKELAKIVEDRGKKGVNKMEQVGRLEMLCTKVKTDTKKIEVLLHVISCLFDTSANMLLAMDHEAWDKTADNIATVLQLLSEKPDFKLLESTDFGDDEEFDVTPAAESTEEVQ